VVREEEAHSLRYFLDPFNFYAQPDGKRDETNSVHRNPINHIRISSHNRIKQKRRAEHNRVKRDEDCDYRSSDHGFMDGISSTF
jgi:hypothetical protein